MTGALEIEIRGEVLHLLPQRAVYWPRTKTLFVADLHLGKVATFRAAGIPLPAGETDADLTRLSVALHQTGAEKLIVLGDLLHARRGRSSSVIDRVTAWREAHASLDMILVRGNHDRSAGDPPPEWNIRTVDGPTPGPLFVLRHEPAPPDDPDAYALAGHLHPVARLRGRGGQSLRLPCFWFGGRVGVLPAFSTFTGGATIRASAADRVFAATAERVFDVSDVTRS